MKAIEYYEKYKDRIFEHITVEDGILTFAEPEINIVVSDMFKEFCDESVELGRKRNTKCSEAVAALVKEQNQKWNAVSNIFEKKDGFSVILTDGYKIWWETHMPELKYFNPRREPRKRGL